MSNLRKSMVVLAVGTIFNVCGAVVAAITLTWPIPTNRLTSLHDIPIGEHIIIDYGSGSSPNSAIQAYVANGIITTASGYAVGYADGADGVVSGLNAGQEEIMATLPGDTNLAGTVNLGDLTTVYNNLGITSGATWDQGDFTASGAVTLEDLTSTYNNVGLSLPSMNMDPAVLPTPASGAILFIGLGGLALLVVRKKAGARKIVE